MNEATMQAKHHADVYKKFKRLYGKHVDQITLHERKVKNRPGVHAFSAVCSEHGVVSEWVTDVTKRNIRVREHLQGLY